MFQKYAAPVFHCSGVPLFLVLLTADVQQKLKQSRPGQLLEPIVLLELVPDRKLCVVTHLREYLKRTKSLRRLNSQLLLFSQFNPVTQSTISRRVKTILKQADIDVSIYTAHSSPAAATSPAQKQALNLQEIMRSVGWTSSSTIDKFYKKPTETFYNFGDVVLNSVV